MYLYFDRYGTLKEQITFNSARVGNSNVNKIFVYWEGVEEFPDWAQELALQTRYLLQDNTQYPSATTFGFSAQPETAELPFDKNQDLKYFKYYKEYKFLTIDIPDEVLSYNGAVKSYIWVLNADKKRILGLGVFAFMVDGDINEVIPDENISLAQWNMISAQLGLLSGSVIDVTCDIATNTLKVYYANGLTAIRNLPPNGAQTTISSDFLREMIFSADTWVQDGENGYYIYFRAETVGYEDNKFFVQLERDGEYNSDYYNKTGSFVLSDNIFKGSDGSVLLYSHEPYSGRLLVVGGDLLSGDILVTGLTYNDVNSQLSYKTADGVTHTIYLGINEKFDKSNVSQTTGDSTVKVMSQKAATDNFARLVDGKVPESQLPSYVDDVVEYDSKSDFPATGETGKIYVDKSTNLTYRWSSNSNNYIMVGGGDLNIENGTGTGSLVQKRLKSDGVTWTTAKAYQGAGAAFGGGTQAGMTFEEWKNDNPTGTQEDYDKSYSFAFAANEDNKALARGSAAFGRYNTAHNIGEFVCGNYADNNRDPRTVFAVGTGIDDSRRSTGFEVRTDGHCYVHNRAIATEEYVGNRAVTKQGNSYVVYINEADGKSAVMPYRFQKNSIINPEYTVMFQPMIDGRLYTRDPEDDYHAANKRSVDKKLDKPLYNPTEDSVVKVSSTGSTSYKKVSELVDTTSEQTITGTKNFESTGKNFCITCQTIIKGVTYTAKLSGGDLLFINDGGSENVQANYGINGVYSRHRTSSSSGLLKLPIDLEGTFAITPNAAPTEPSFIVTASDRTPTWKPVSELDVNALKVTVW